MPNDPLLRELEAAGASHPQAHQLLAIAQQLRALQNPGQERPRSRHSFVVLFERITIYAASSAVLVAAAGVIIGISLSAQPGQALYGVKTAVEALEVRVDPATRPQIMMERSHEVANLVGTHQPSTRILATLADYNRIATQVSSGSSYPAWDYCASQLRTARANSSGQVQAAVAASLNRFHLDDS